MTRAEVRQLYFDDPAIRRFMDLKTLSALSRAGAFLRQRARTSMRYRPLEHKRGPLKGQPNHSATGEPPYAHKETGAHIRKRLEFAFDTGSKSLVVGPKKFGAGRAPNVQEFGSATGTTTVAGRRIPGRFPARSFMGPAMREEIKAGTIPRQWSPSVNG